MNNVKLISIKTPILEKDAIIELFQVIKEQKININNGDVFVVTTKLISFDENRIIKLENIKVSKKARELAKKYKMDPSITELVVKEADRIYGGTDGVLLTLKDNIVIANAGIDKSNVRPGYVALWPKNPIKSAEKIRNTAKKYFKTKIGVVISDSHCLPLRRGASAIAIAIAGFEGVIDMRRGPDLYNQPLKITQVNIADQLASSANMLMGEADEHIPAVIIKNAPIKLSNRKASILTKSLIMPRDKCLFREYGKMT